MMQKIDIHIGELVETVFNKRNITKAEFARRINTTRQNVTSIFKRPDMDVKLLFTISNILEYDFFQHFSTSPVKSTTEAEVSIQLNIKTQDAGGLFKWISDNSNLNIIESKNPQIIN